MRRRCPTGLRQCGQTLRYKMAQGTIKLRVKNPKKVAAGILAAAHDIGILVFFESRVNVPVLTGELKASGKLDLNDRGFVIEYTAGHASKQEFGRDPGFTEHVDKHLVKRHRRRGLVKASKGTTVIPRHSYRKDGKLIIVKRHRRTINVPAGMRVEDVKQHSRGPFDRTYPRGIEGKYYLSRAYGRYKPDIRRRLLQRLGGA